MSKKLYIKTYGCQMNVYDSTRMADILSPLGYHTVGEPDDADMVILNTCHIREKATEKVFSDLGRLKAQKEAKAQKGEKMVIAVAGCVAQAEGDVIMNRANYVNMVFGPQTYHELPEMVLRATTGTTRERIINTDFPIESKFDHLPATTGVDGPSAFLSVQEGCDKFCTFCVVPYTRGAEFSRPAKAILDEAQGMVVQGVCEITLLGQNVNAWHGDGLDGKTWGLGRLIQELANINGLLRIRYMTSHPLDMDDELMIAHRDVPALMPYLHLPVQSGSDNILKLMNRKHTADDYRRIIDRLRALKSDLALSSDFIVGFPGETEQDHRDTINLVEDVKFASAFSFKYSARPGTPAANMQGLVPEKIKSDRLTELQEILFRQQEAFNLQTVGKTVGVLFDGYNEQTARLHGKSPWLQSVSIAGNPPLLGRICDVKITRASTNKLEGEIVTTEETTKTNPQHEKAAA